jgi:hypothetical protein
MASVIAAVGVLARLRHRLLRMIGGVGSVGRGHTDAQPLSVHLEEVVGVIERVGEHRLILVCRGGPPWRFEVECAAVEILTRHRLAPEPVEVGLDSLYLLFGELLSVAWVQYEHPAQHEPFSPFLLLIALEDAVGVLNRHLVHSFRISGPGGVFTRAHR